MKCSRSGSARNSNTCGQSGLQPQHIAQCVCTDWVNDSIHVEIEIIDPRIIADGLPHAAAILDAIGAAAGTAIVVGLIVLRHWFRFICTSLRCILHRLWVSLGEPFEERRHAHGGSRSEWQRATGSDCGPTVELRV